MLATAPSLALDKLYQLPHELIKQIMLDELLPRSGQPWRCHDGRRTAAVPARRPATRQRLVQSGLVSNFTTMKIITVWAEAEIATTRLSGAA
jgi:hypothetical protein